MFQLQKENEPKLLEDDGGGGQAAEAVPYGEGQLAEQPGSVSMLTLTLTGHLFNSIGSRRADAPGGTTAYPQLGTGMIKDEPTQPAPGQQHLHRQLRQTGVPGLEGWGPQGQLAHQQYYGPPEGSSPTDAPMQHSPALGRAHVRQHWSWIQDNRGLTAAFGSDGAAGGSSSGRSSQTMDPEELDGLSPANMRHRLFGKDLTLPLGAPVPHGMRERLSPPPQLDLNYAKDLTVPSGLQERPSKEKSPHGHRKRRHADVSTSPSDTDRASRGRAGHTQLRKGADNDMPSPPGRPNFAADAFDDDDDDDGGPRGPQSTRPRSVAERKRRGRISMRLEKLKATLPVWNPRLDTASMLDQAIAYINGLKRDVRRLEAENERLQQHVPQSALHSVPTPQTQVPRSSHNI